MTELTRPPYSNSGPKPAAPTITTGPSNGPDPTARLDVTALTVPHFWALDHPDRLPAAPAGWELQSIGTIDGEPFAIATSAVLHDVAVVTRPGLSPAVNAGFTESGWKRFARTDANEIWWRDRRPAPTVARSVTVAALPARAVVL